MAIKVKTRDEKQGLEEFLRWVEDDLISVYELYCYAQADPEDGDALAEAIKAIAGIRMNIEVGSAVMLDGKLQNIKDRISKGDSDFDIARETKVSVETVRRVRRNS